MQKMDGKNIWLLKVVLIMTEINEVNWLIVFYYIYIFIFIQFYEYIFSNFYNSYKLIEGLAFLIESKKLFNVTSISANSGLVLINYSVTFSKCRDLS